jgi:hypothetical protein
MEGEKMSPPNKSITLLFNPFYYLAGVQALGLGLAAILLAALAGSWGRIHFDGVLDTHVGAAAPRWFFCAEGIIDWLSLSAVLWVGGKLISQSAFRAVDLLGTQALARWPTLCISLIALPKAFQRFGHELTEQLKQGKFHFDTPDAIVFFAVVMATIPFICWVVALMYKSFSVSCNVKGGKAVGAFIAGLLIAEVLSKVCLALVAPHLAVQGIIPAKPAAAATAAAGDQAVPFDSTTEAAGDIAEAGARFVDLLVKEDFAGAVAQFDATMRSALPELKLREVWQTLRKQAGQFKTQLRTRMETLGGYNVVFVTCRFEQADLDAKVVFDARKQIAGLFFVPSTAAPGSFAPPPYAKAGAFGEKDFTVGAGEWSLPGTLTLPAEVSHPSPAVVLVHGSGPNDRDETILANKPFRDLAWGLAAKGIAVLRYEKRTKEHGAKLAAAGLSQLTVKEETMDDALSAVAQLGKTDGIDPKRIFVLGHSLGGTVAPRIGQADPALAGLIILAGATRPLEDLMVEQTRYLLRLGGQPSEEAQAKLSDLLAEVAKVKKLTAADASSPGLLLNAPPQYWLDLREHDPLAAAKTLRQPLLILQGGRDYQVTETDFAGWQKALSSQPGVTFKLYPKLNHLFMTGEGASTPAEYERPGHVAESVIDDIAEWILKTNPAP